MAVYARSFPGSSATRGAATAPTTPVFFWIRRSSRRCSSILNVLLFLYLAADEGRNGGAPSGTISAFDGKRGQSIYKRDQTVAPQQEEHPNPGAKQNEEKTVQLLLTGPYRAISADGCVAIEIDLHHDCKETSSDVALSGRKSCVVHIIDVYNDLTEYDVPVTEVVKTCIHCDESPNAEIKYALLSDAAEASVEVKLVRQPDDLSDGCRVQGKIIACTSVGEVVLFKSNNKKTIIGSPQEPMIIPLARSVLAVPLDSSLEIKVDLHIPSTEETVKYSVEWNPDNFDWEKPLLHFDCTNGQVDVKVTLSY